MADTYTTNLRFTKPEVGANVDSWADLLNSGMIQLIEDAVAGEVEVDVTSGNVALTEGNGATDEARSMFIRATGAPGVTRTIATASASKVYVVSNESDGDVIIAPAVGSGVTVEPGNITMVYIEAGVAAYEILPEGEYIPVEGGTLTAISVNVRSSVGTVFDTVNMYYHLQGNLVYINFEPWSAVAIDSNGINYLPVSGSWPTEILPSIQQTIPAHLQEDQGGGFTDFVSAFRILGGPTSIWQFQENTPLDTYDYQMVRPLTFVYPLGSTP